MNLTTASTGILRRGIAPVLAALLCAAGAPAGELVGARYSFKPDRPYMNQPFEIRLELDVSPGTEVQDMQLEGIPLDSYALLTPYQKEDRRQVRRNDRTVDVLAFVAAGRPANPVRQTFSGTLRATLVERRSLGFFTSVSSSTAAVRLEPLHVEFRPLPAANVPPGFQGAVGTFRLTGQLDPPQAAPGDIVNLVYILTGNGWIGNAQMLFPAPNPDFRIYPPQETRRDENGHLALRQVLVPLNTNATRIGTARFPYFDPVACEYREAATPPLRLTLIAAQAPGTIPAVKRVDLQPAPATPEELGNATVAATMNRARHLLPFAGVFALAVIVAALLYAWRPRLALAAGVVLFMAGVYLCQRGDVQTRPRGREVRELAQVRLCPSAGARVLFHIAPGRLVTPLEVSESWVRVDSEGQRGWIPASALKP